MWDKKDKLASHVNTKQTSSFIQQTSGQSNDGQIHRRQRGRRREERKEKQL